MTAGPEGKLITNDELRDHVFQMLPAPRLFYKWKERHQARTRNCSLLLPAISDVCWHAPACIAGSLPVHAWRSRAASASRVHDVHPGGHRRRVVDVPLVRVGGVAVCEAQARSVKLTLLRVFSHRRCNAC